MKNENILFIIQTSDSSSVFITEELFPHDDDRIQIAYSVSEVNNPLCRTDSCYENLVTIFLHYIGRKNELFNIS
jgi:hypothetical protein